MNETYFYLGFTQLFNKSKEQDRLLFQGSTGPAGFRPW